MIHGLVLTFALLAAGPSDDFGQKEKRFDLVELNQFYDGDGVWRYSQLLFQRWDHETNEYRIAEYRVIDSLSMRNYKKKGFVRLPHQTNEGWEVSLTEGNLPTRFIASKFRETWTQYDPCKIEADKKANEMAAKSTLAMLKKGLIPTFCDLFKTDFKDIP